MSTLPTIDTRKAWLDEVSIVTNTVLRKLTEKEIKGRNLTPIEKQYAKICGAYLYLLNLAEENNLLLPDDPNNPFNLETIH